MMTHLRSNICDTLRQARLDNRLTYLEVANRSGLSISTLVNAERKIPSPRTIRILAKIYGINVKLAQNTKGNVIYL